MGYKRRNNKKKSLKDNNVVTWLCFGQGKDRLLIIFIMIFIKISRKEGMWAVLGMKIIFYNQKLFSSLLLRFQNLTWQTQDLLPNSIIRFSIHIKMTWLPSFTSNNWISWECWYCKFTMRVKSWHLKLFNFKSLILYVQLHVHDKALSSSHLSVDWMTAFDHGMQTQ